ncbi:MAG: thioredoxin family protein [Deltaproteobacteria bacterium]|nr:thioredoxin family protein [Deltaproteobacteria bacterium]
MGISNLLLTFSLISQPPPTPAVDCLPSPKTEANDILKAAEVEEINWQSSFEAAQADAIKTKRDLFVLFTSEGNWCTGCVRLEKYVFPNKEFIQGTNSDFTFVKFVFPKNPVTEKIAREADSKLQEAYRFQGKFDLSSFPKMILFTSDGRAYSRPSLGNTESAENFLKEIIKDKDNKNSVFEKLEKIKANPNKIERQKDLHEFISDMEIKGIAFNYQNEMKELASDSPYADIYKYHLAMYAAKESFGHLDSQKALDYLNQIPNTERLPLDYQRNILVLKRYAFGNLKKPDEVNRVIALTAAVDAKINNRTLEGKLGEQK